MDALVRGVGRSVLTLGVPILHEGEMMRRLGTVRLGKAVMSVVLALTTAMPVLAQRDHQDRRSDSNQYNGGSNQYNDGLRQEYNGRNGGYNDQYDRRRYNDQRYQNGRYNDGRYNSQDEYNRTHGGIGPGKGALIGGAGGAALGAIFGGGLKGAIIGGGVGAGGGAIVGKIHQNNKQNDWRDYPDGRR